MNSGRISGHTPCLFVVLRVDLALVSKDMERVTGSRRLEVTCSQKHAPTAVKVKSDSTAGGYLRAAP